MLQSILHRIPYFIFHALGIVSRHLFQVVNDDHPRHRSALLIENSGVVIVCDIHPVGDPHDRAVFVILLRADQIAEHLIFVAADFYQARIGGFSLHQPGA